MKKQFEKEHPELIKKINNYKKYGHYKALCMYNGYYAEWTEKKLEKAKNIIKHLWRIYRFYMSQFNLHHDINEYTNMKKKLENIFEVKNADL